MRVAIHDSAPAEEPQDREPQDRSTHAVRLSGWNRQGRLRSVVAVAVLLTLPATAFLLGRRSKTLAESVNEALPPAPVPVTAAVEFGLLGPGDVFRGLVAAQEVAITLQLSEPSLVTSQTSEAGDTVTEGMSLVEIDDRPVLPLAGDLPLINDLKPGDQGSVVEQLQRSLQRTGHLDAGDFSGVFDANTSDAIASLYRAGGFDPPPLVGVDELTQAMDAVIDAEDAVAAATSAYREARSAGIPTGDLLRALNRSRADLESAEAALTTAQALVGVPLPASEVVFVSRLPATIIAPPPQRGTVVDGLVDVAIVAGGRPFVRVDLRTTETDQFAPGSRIEIVDEDPAGKPGVVRAVEARSDGVGPVEAFVARIEFDELPWSALGTGVRLRPVVEEGGIGENLIVPSLAIRSDSGTRLYVLKHLIDGDSIRVEVLVLGEAGGFSSIEPLDPGSLSDRDRVVVGFDTSADREPP